MLVETLRRAFPDSPGSAALPKTGRARGGSDLRCAFNHGGAGADDILWPSGLASVSRFRHHRQDFSTVAQVKYKHGRQHTRRVNRFLLSHPNHEVVVAGKQWIFGPCSLLAPIKVSAR